MRRLVNLALASGAVVAIAACGKSKPTESALSADLQRDLKAASASASLRINPDEIAPKAKQELAMRPKAAPTGPKVVRTSHPRVMASAKPAEIAEVPTEVPQVQVMASAPAPSETPSTDAPPLARPSAIPAQSYPSAGNEPSAGSGAGGIMAGIWGAVIRGGVIGDDDHCDPRPPRRGGRPVGGGANGTYGRPGGMNLPGVILGGMGRSRFP